MKFVSSIKGKLIILINLFIGVLLVVIAIGTHLYFSDIFRDLIFKQQFSIVKQKANDLDQLLGLIQNSLINVANVAPKDIINNPNLAKEWLSNRRGIRTFFNHNLTILDTKGLIIAAIPDNSEKSGAAYSFSDYYVDAIKYNKSIISAPYKSLGNGHPIVTMSALIKDENGQTIGLLCGSIDLIDSDGLFADIRKVKLGTNGYMYMFAKDRTMILHPDSTRILQKDVKVGANKLFDEAIKGFEGSDETYNSKGLHFLASFKQIPTTGWILAANYPYEEAIAPIVTYRDYYLITIFLVMLAAFFMISRLTYGFLDQITSYINQIHELAGSSNTEKRIDIVRNDEIGKLASSFNQLMDELSERDIEQKQLFDKLMESNSTIEENLFEKNVLIEELSQTKDRLELINAEKDKFFSIIAHDLRSPFSGFLGLTKIMAEESEDLTDAEFKQYSILLMNSANSLYKLLSNLLEWTRIQRGSIEISMQYIDIKAAFNNVIEHQTIASNQKEITILNLVKTDENVYADQNIVNTIIRNLVSNSIKFTPRGGKIELGIDTNQIDESLDRSKYLVLYVKDNGIGMDEETINKLFRMDQKVTRSGTENEPSTGLGLLLCKEFIDRIGGKIWVESKVNEGTTFYFTLLKTDSK